MNIIHKNVWEIIISESKKLKIKRVVVSYLTNTELLTFTKGD